MKYFHICCSCFWGTKLFTFYCTELYTQPPLNTTPLNPPDSIEETLSLLQVPLWYILCWPLLDHIGWLHACWNAVWHDMQKGFNVIAFPLFRAIHSAMTHTTLSSPERWVGTRLTHTQLQQSSLHARCTQQTWVMWQEKRKTAAGCKYFYLFFFTLNPWPNFHICFFIFTSNFIDVHLMTTKWWTCSKDLLHSKLWYSFR